MFEKIIFSNLYNNLTTTHHLITKTQYGFRSNNLLNPILVLQKKFVRLATFNDLYPPIPGPLAHTPSLFHKLNLLNIYDIYKLQVSKLVYDSLNNIGPVQGIISFMRASELHSHVTRFSTGGNLHTNSVRTSSSV